MFKKVGVEAIISSDAEHIQNAKKYLLPGVGSFDYGITKLRNAPFYSLLEREVLENKKPTLGICLGMQMLTKGSEEGNQPGLGWVDATTVKFNAEKIHLPIPHMGWNHVSVKSPSGLFTSLEENRFYFVHSYHVKCERSDLVLATCSYGDEFTCSIQQDNIYGVQFHPEKSHKFGMQLLKNFGNL